MSVPGSPHFGPVPDPSDAELLQGIPRDVRVRLGMSSLLAAKGDADQYARDEVATVDGGVRSRAGSMRSLDTAASVDLMSAATPTRRLVDLYALTTPADLAARCVVPWCSCARVLLCVATWSATCGGC